MRVLDFIFMTRRDGLITIVVLRPSLLDRIKRCNLHPALLSVRLLVRPFRVSNFLEAGLRNFSSSVNIALGRSITIGEQI